MANVRVKIKDVDRGYTERLRKIANVNTTSARVGIMEPQASKVFSGTTGLTTVAEIAGAHEFGVPDFSIPRRSFIRDWFDQNKNDNIQIMKSAAIAIAKGIETLEQGLENAGEILEASMKENILSGISPANKPATLKKKQGSTPLIDRGVLFESITHNVGPRRGK